MRGTVIIFSTAYLPFLGGAETAIKGITDEIHDTNFILLTGRFHRELPRREQIGNVEVWRLGLGRRADKFLLPALAGFAFLSLRKNLDEPLLFWAMMVSYSSLAALWLKYLFPKIPLLLTLQEGDSEEHIRRARFGLIAVFWRLLVQKADRIQVISHYLKGLCLDFGARSPIEVVPNGVELERFMRPEAQNTNQNSRVVITVSRLAPKNGIDVLIRALAEVRKSIPDVECWIIGDGPERGSLELGIRKYELGERVKFFGTVPHEEVPRYLACARMFVRPSRSEGLGTAFLEAMAAGVPVIGTRVGGIKDFLEDGKTGLSVRPDDARELAQKIILLFRDNALRERLIREGRRLVEAEYQWSNIALRMQRIFSSLL